MGRNSTNTVFLYQIKDSKRIIKEYRSLSVKFPEHKTIHGTCVKEELGKIKIWKEHLK